MPKKTSAGILLFRRRGSALEVFLVHPGGPFWAKKDVGAWSLPKGEIEEGEDALAAARRELQEETGFVVEGAFRELKPQRQRSGKTIVVWAVEADVDPAQLRSGTFTMEWPPRSGKQREFPEVDRGEWFALDEARQRINAGQIGFLEELD